MIMMFHMSRRHRPMAFAACTALLAAGLSVLIAGAL
jgi:hypothetical protein